MYASPLRQIPLTTNNRDATATPRKAAPPTLNIKRLPTTEPRFFPVGSRQIFWRFALSKNPRPTTNTPAIDQRVTLFIYSTGIRYAADQHSNPNQTAITPAPTNTARQDRSLRLCRLLLIGQSLS